MKNGGAEAIKLEGGRNRVNLVKRLVDEEIPVVAHIGLTPQSVHKLGGYRVQGKTAEAAQKSDRRRENARRSGRICDCSGTRPARNCRNNYRRIDNLDHRHRRGLGCDIQVLVLHDLVGFHSADCRVLSVNTPTSAKL